MTSPGITLSRHVSASPEQVWRVLTDIPGSATTLRGVSRIEMLSTPPYGVDTRWRETRTMFGRETTEEIRVSRVDAPSSTVVEAEISGTHYTTAFSLVPDERGTLLSMIFTAESTSTSTVKRLLHRTIGRVGTRMAAKEMRLDLEDIAIAAEKSA